MIFVNELQKDTLLLLDDLIEKNKTHEEIQDILQWL